MDWNELEFTRWKDFRQMAPSIVQLEITRLSKLLRSVPVDSQEYNSLVKARFELKTFVACLKEGDREKFSESCLPHLQWAMVALATVHFNSADPASETLAYIAERLNYIYKRAGMLLT